MRCWLFGSLIIQKTTPPDTIDQEVHSLSAILHDLGWDNTGEFISNDKRFEVDRAIAARNFVEEEVWNGRAHGWDEHRKQLVWDTIALHSTPSIAMYKQPVVGLVGAEIASDFQGPNSDPTGTLTWDEYHAVVKGFPRLDLAGGVRKIICGFIDTKPNTTIGNGCNHMVVKFRADTYTVMGRSAFEMIEAALK
ncbi:hypothetical protein E6O75_ATG07874 [Venturia nashicola]|uniref:HD domain-containing protein n=1 Tax=Venturia nashicola TaxID=86259 RepID=A0A4Z1NN34_9PEZI|nr:hypothetical protein E6O75_ATG07874 [Venturia nashicola]